MWLVTYVIVIIVPSNECKPLKSIAKLSVSVVGCGLVWGNILN